MKPVAMGTPERDLGWAEIRPLAENLIQELERQAKKIQALERRAGEAAPPAVGLAEARRLLARLPLRTADAVTLERQRILHRAIDEAYFRVPIAPGAALYEGGVVTEVLNNDAWAMRFPAGATGAADVQVPTRELWVGTRPRIDVWYTSPVGSTANFDFRFGLWVHGPDLTTTYAPPLVSWTAPGPAVANTVLKTSAVITSSRFPTSPYGVTRLRLGRLTGDANANARDVLAAVVIFEEVA